MDEFETRVGYIRSPRMKLLAADRDLIAADLAGREALAETLGCRAPEQWPPELFDRPVMELAAHELRDPEAQGWSYWYLLREGGDDADAELVGLAGFKGRPDTDGEVEISYSILPDRRREGLATEAVAALVRWAFGHGRVRRVVAETLPYLRQSITVLERNGFVPDGAGSEYGVVRYVVGRDRLR